ncbi:MAG: cation diffusion facilitator family transporter [Clostridiales bacterium]|nr:cation diffusion facilitator family transporter [Clostridiales bacterium]
MVTEKRVADSVVKNSEREKVIVKTSIIGIIANVFLSAFKAAVGTAVNSIAVILDAVNNLSDALSSVITIVGAKLSGKAPDKKHPLGYGRIEYISQTVVAAIVLYAGVTSLVESVKKIINPEKADYSVASLIIISSAIVVKLILGLYVKKKGKAVNSGSLTASGSDALFDAVLSLSVLISAFVYIIFDISLEAYVGVIISGFIIKSGIEMIKEAVDEILGHRADEELPKKIRETVLSYPEVCGVYDIFINNYGPDKNICSLHVEVSDKMTASEIDGLTRKISEAVYLETGVIIVAIGVYSMNPDDSEAGKISADVRKTVFSHEGVLQMHGFYLDEEKKSMTFDIIIDFAVKDRNGLYETIKKEIAEKYPDLKTNITLDIDVSD